MKKIELNLIDKAVAFINPQRAVERLIARKKLTKFEYDAVKYTRERELKEGSSKAGARSGSVRLPPFMIVVLWL